MEPKKAESKYPLIGWVAPKVDWYPQGVFPWFFVRWQSKHWPAPALYGLMAPALNGPGRGEGGRLRVSVIDVGQGDALLAEFPDGTNVLVDAGPRTTAMDAGTRIVVPFLKRCGISTIDLLIVSHMHADHSGGVPGVLSGLYVKQLLVLSPQALRDGLGPLLSPDAAFRCDSVRPGTVLLRSPCARIYLLSPAPGGPLGPDPSGNASLVLKLQYGEVAFLLTGVYIYWANTSYDVMVKRVKDRVGG